ncbi:MAG: hypothetical protein HYY84_18970 [Deltaproteobacteria bacterium]|nr:hypothetical protein [Deltaproteobacteria bacterium]
MYDAGSASNETLIDSDAGPGLYDPPPRVAVDAIGNAFAIWVRQFPSRALAGRLFSAASNSWEDAGTVSINSDAGSFSLALAATGNGVVVWQQHDGIRHNIWHSRFVPNATWTTPGLVENTSLGDSTSPRVAIAPNGDAVAVWLLSEGVQTNVWANRFVVASGLWGTESRIDSPISGTSSSALVEVDSLGNAVAAWNRTDGGQTSVWINRGSADGGWADATMISAATDGYLPSLTTNGSGTAAVLWTASGTAWMRVCR